MTAPIPGTFSSKRAERMYVRYDAISGLPVSVVMRMTDGSKVLFPLFQYSVVPNVLSMNPNMPVPVETLAEDVLSALNSVNIDLNAMLQRITALEQENATLKKNGVVRGGTLTKTITKVVGGQEDFVVPLDDGGFADALYNATASIQDIGGVLGSTSPPMIIGQTATTVTVRVQATGVLNNKTIKINVEARKPVVTAAAAAQQAAPK